MILEKRWNGPRIIFRFMQCPLCKQQVNKCVNVIKIVFSLYNFLDIFFHLPLFEWIHLEIKEICLSMAADFTEAN